MSARRLTWVVLALVATTPAAAALVPQVAEGLGPGTHLLVDVDGQTFGCTAAWVYRDGAGERYLSTAGHCLLSPFSVATHGPDADGPSDARVRACIDRCVFGGQTGFLLSGRTVELGSVAYARQFGFGGAVGNDFGLVRIPRALDGEVRYGLPEFGEAARVRDVRLGDHMCYYGAGLATGETFLTMGREGVGLATIGTSWRMAGASAEGDSGAAVATCDAQGDAVAAAGILTHLTPGGVAGTTMGRAAQMAREAGLVVTPVLSR